MSLFKKGQSPYVGGWGSIYNVLLGCPINGTRGTVLKTALQGYFFGGPKLKRWNGSTWVLTNIKQYNGSSWTAHQIKRWDGKNWVLLETKIY